MSPRTVTLTNFTSGELSPRLEGRVDLSRYYNGCRELVNFIVHPHGGVTRRGGLRLAAEAGNPDQPSLLLAFEFNAEQAYVLEFYEDAAGAGRMRVFRDGGLVLGADGAAFALETPYRRKDFARLRWTQSNDTLFLVHPDHAPRTLTRSGHAEWTLAEAAFTGRPESWGEGNWPTAVCFYEQRLVLAATPTAPNTLWFSRSGDFFDLRRATREVPLEGWRDVELAEGAGSAADGRSGNQFTLYAGDASFQGGSALKARDASGEQTRYYRYKGALTRLAATSDLTVAMTLDAPGAAQIEAVRDAAGALRAEFWEEFAPGDRIDAPVGQGPLDDDGIEVTLSAAQANAIEFLAPKARLWIGTAGGEWTVSGGDGGAVSPLNIKASQEGVSGSARVRPESVGQGTLYVQRSGRKLRELSYSFEADGLSSRDLTLLSEHLTEGGITGLAFVRDPDPVLFCLRADGVLLALTYEPGQDVFAWSRQVTAGAVESLAAIPDPAEGRERLWVVVRREVGGRTRRFVETLEAGLLGDDPAQAFFVDCGLTWRGEPAEVLGGLEHLAGETVDVLADGAVQPPRAVAADGTIRLDRPARVVHAGLPFTSALTTMRLESGGGTGTSQTRRKRIVQVSARFYRTLGGRLGAPGGRMETMHFRRAADGMGRAPALWSGDKTVKFPQGSDLEGCVRVEADRPLPMTVLMLVPELAQYE